MKKKVALITAIILALNIASSTALAINRLPIQTPPPKAQIKCLPICALPALPLVIKGLTDLAILLSMITITIVESKDVPIELEAKMGRNKPKKIIYRDGSGTSTNLTPRPNIVNGQPIDKHGLSYWDRQPKAGTAYTAIACEAVNATLKLVCYADPKTPGHWMIKATDSKKHVEWMNSRANAETSPHEYTKILMMLSVKVKR